MPRSVLGSRRFVAASLVVVATLAAALLAPLLGGNPFEPSDSLLETPSLDHPFGTDELGRDIFTRVLHGAATALLVAIPPAIVAGLIGAAVGLAAGYAGGLLDEVALKLIELILVIPRFLLAIVVVALFGGSLWLVSAVLVLTFWPHTARLVRGEAISLRERPFVEAARAVGGSSRWILARHLWPSMLPLLAVNVSFQAGQGALIESGLAFLGLGDRDVVSWGAMLADAQSYIGIAWWTSVPPGIALGMLILALNLVGDGLSDAWNVRRTVRLQRGE